DPEVADLLLLDIGFREAEAGGEGDALAVLVLVEDMECIVDRGGGDVNALDGVLAGVEEGEGGGGDAGDVVGAEGDLDLDGTAGLDLGRLTVSDDLGREEGGMTVLEVAEGDGGGDVEVVGAGEGAGAALTDDDVAEVEAGGVADELALRGAADEANSLFRLALVGGEDDEGLEIVLGGGLHGHLEEAAVPRAEFEGAGGEGEGSRDTPDVLNLHVEGGVAGVDDVDLGREAAPDGDGAEIDGVMGLALRVGDDHCALEGELGAGLAVASRAAGTGEDGEDERSRPRQPTPGPVHANTSSSRGGAQLSTSQLFPGGPSMDQFARKSKRELDRARSLAPCGPSGSGEPLGRQRPGDGPGSTAGWFEAWP